VHNAGFLVGGANGKIDIIEVKLNTTSTPLVQVPGSGGFMDPERIAAGFGLAEGMHVADFGSGSGYFTILMAKKVGESGIVTAVDVLESALDTLRAKAANEGLGNIKTVRANLEVLGSSGLSDNSQDSVLIANVLFQSTGKASIIEEARRIIKPGGSLIVIDWRKGTGGLGPPDDLRTDKEEMKQLVSYSNGWQFGQDIDAGAFHYGLIFRKV